MRVLTRHIVGRLTPIGAALAPFLAASCSESPLEVALNRTYALSGCEPAGAASTEGLPCLYYFSGGRRAFVDSGKIVLQTDRTLSFTFFTREVTNPCYTTNVPCATTQSDIKTGTGQYRIADRSLLMRFDAPVNATDPGEFTASSDVPSDISRSWPGPAQLRVKFDHVITNQPHAGVFTP